MDVARDGCTVELLGTSLLKAFDRYQAGKNYDRRDMASGVSTITKNLLKTGPYTWTLLAHYYRRTHSMLNKNRVPECERAFDEVRRDPARFFPKGKKFTVNVVTSQAASPDAVTVQLLDNGTEVAKLEAAKTTDIRNSAA